MTIIEEKAQWVVRSLVEAGLMDKKDWASALKLVREGFASGGSCTIFETPPPGPRQLVVRTIVRDETGRVTGMQG